MSVHNAKNLSVLTLPVFVIGGTGAAAGGGGIVGLRPAAALAFCCCWAGVDATVDCPPLLARVRVLGTHAVANTPAASSATTQDAEADRTKERDIFMGEYTVFSEAPTLAQRPDAKVEKEYQKPLKDESLARCTYGERARPLVLINLLCGRSRGCRCRSSASATTAGKP